MPQRHSGLSGNRATRRINIARATWRGRIQRRPPPTPHPQSQTQPLTARPGPVGLCLCVVCLAASFASGGVSFLPRQTPADVSWRSMRRKQCVRSGWPGRVGCGCAGDRGRDGAGRAGLDFQEERVTPAPFTLRRRSGESLENFPDPRQLFE